MCFGCCWAGWADDHGTTEGAPDRCYRPLGNHHRHLRHHRPSRAVIDGWPATESPDDGPPVLTLSVIHLPRSVRAMDHRTVEGALAAVLDDLPCASPSDADRLRLLGRAATHRRRHRRPRGGGGGAGAGGGGAGADRRRAAAEESVMRFRLERDRWTSLASLLLKSAAYHRSRGDMGCEPSSGEASPSSSLSYRSRGGADDPEGPDDGVGDGRDRGAEDGGSRKTEEGGRKLPVVDLPRTEYNRPYLPRRPNYSDDDGDDDDDDCDDGESTRPAPSPPPPPAAAAPSRRGEGIDEDRDNPMNVSHQYPWVCMVQRRRRSSPSLRLPPGERAHLESSSSPSSRGMLLGLDVVVFEARISSYSPTVTEFLEPFARSFTPWEWERISNDGRRPSSSDRRRAGSRGEDSRLREFFLRWSMKEAYTKALGLGMHVDFDRLEIRLYGTDLDAESDEDGGRYEEGIWTSIERHTASSTDDRWGRGVVDERRRRYYSAIGKVKRLESTTSSWEVWEFIFVPLFLGDDDDDDRDRDDLGLPRAAERDERAGGPSPPRWETAAVAGGGSAVACACICRGPLPRNASGGRAERCRAALELLTLTDLIRMHGCTSL
jgi:hypothetical protein